MSTSQDTVSTGELMLLLGLGTATVAGAALWVTSGLGTTVTGHGWQPVPGPEVAGTLARIPSHLSHLRDAYPATTHTQLPPSGVLWLLLLTILAVVASAGFSILRLAAHNFTSPTARPRQRPARAGLASRRDIHQHLSARAVRARATQTRPSLTGHFATREVGLALGHDLRTRQQIWGSVEDSYLYLGPPRSGKGVHLVIPQALDAPGALLVTSTRPDTLHATRTHRQTRGPVLVFDPQSLAPGEPRLRWAPTRGCTDPLVAINRARALAAGAMLTKGSTSDGEYWQQMTAAVLRTYLHAAALTGRPISDVLAWASRPSDPTPVRILRQESAAAGGWAEELAAQAGADPRQRDSVWSGVRRAVDSLADPRVLDACSPDTVDAFDPHEFLDANGSLYLLGTTGVQLSVAPLITALLEDLLDTARKRAAALPGGRLDPPLLLLLDEAANIAPIPSLPNLMSDGGGSGITTVAVLQSLAQARARWGETGADSMWDAATTKVVLGGLAHAEDLHRISRLAGDIDRPLVTRSTGANGPSRSVTSQRLPALPLERIRCLPAGQALVLARRVAPVHVQLDPWWQHPTQQSRTRQGAPVR